MAEPLTHASPGLQGREATVYRKFPLGENDSEKQVTPSLRFSEKDEPKKEH